MDDAQKTAEALGTYETIIGWSLVIGVALIAYWTLLDWCTIRNKRHRKSHRIRRRKHSIGNKNHTPNTRPVVNTLSSSDEKPASEHWECAIMFVVAVDEESQEARNAPARLPDRTRVERPARKCLP